MFKILKLFRSMQLTASLMLVYAFAIAIATIVETVYDIESARVLIYGAKWFDILHLMLFISTVLNLKKFKMLNSKRWSVGLFHLSFLFIVIGASLTRYVGEEGVMRIREGESESRFISRDRYLSISIEDNGEQVASLDKVLDFSEDFFFEKSVELDGIEFIITEYLKSCNPRSQSKLVYAKGSSISGISLKVVAGKDQVEFPLIFVDGDAPMPRTIDVGERRVTVSFGSKYVELPFSIELVDFNLTRYLGSDTPSGYESVVKLNDDGDETAHTISMNNVLDHGGYRFFQSFYDNDEKGTILSVSKDRFGTLVTYIGYLFMILGMVISIFNKHSYLSKRLRDAGKVITIAVIFFLSTGNMSASNIVTEQAEDRFGDLMLKGRDGRIMPLSTYADNLLLKIYGKNRYEGMSGKQVILNIIISPSEWQSKPIIKVTNKELRKILGLKGDYASYMDLFDWNSREYKLKQQSELVSHKSPSQHNMLEKEIVKVDERANVFYMVYSQMLLPIYPDPSNGESWISPYDIEDGSGLISANDGVELLSKIENIAKYQIKYGKDLPSQAKIKFESFYNRVPIFKTLFPIYMTIGLVLAFAIFISILRKGVLYGEYIRWVKLFIYILFAIHTVGLILRGYISGHMPWSNGYESMLYVSWCSILAGLLFTKRNGLVLAASALMGGVMLLVAHLSWINPEITNLVPVLKSHWLTFHVSVITASYGFLGISAFIGLFNLILFSFKRNRDLIIKLIDQLTAINEVSVTIGLYLLTIGTFLGGIWANESWGRYWGWDPKETWSLVSILIYSFVAHMRLIPGFKGEWSYNFASSISFSSIIMTYLGVNYYLTGLHSYGASEAGETPIYMIGVLIIYITISIVSYFRANRYLLK